MTLLSFRNCWIRSGWIPHPPIPLTSFFNQISKFFKLFIHNPKYWNSLHVLNILKCNYLRFDGHSFVLLKMTSISMVSGRNPHPPITFRVKKQRIHPVWIVNWMGCLCKKFLKIGHILGDSSNSIFGSSVCIPTLKSIFLTFYFKFKHVLSIL